MRIAFDLRRMGNLGIGRYMKCLVEAILAEEPNGDYVLILPPGAERKISIGSSQPKAVVSRLKYYSIHEQIGLPKLLRDYKVDLLHEPHFMLPLLRPCRSVITLHDVIGLARKENIGSRLGQLYYRLMISAAARLTDKIITDSEYSRDDIIRLLGVRAEKIRVIYPGIDSGFYCVKDADQLNSVRSKYRIEKAFVIYTGFYRPRKNHAALLRAFQKFTSHGGDANLVLVGPIEEGENELRHLGSELGIADRVIFTGFVDDLVLRALYSASRVYACPSLYEGFGFTVLEAMACGTPVVCAPVTSLPEVAGDSALYADPGDSEQFGKALYDAFADVSLRDRLIQRGRRNVERFSWAKAAHATLSVYREAFGTPPQEDLARPVAGRNVA